MPIGITQPVIDKIFACSVARYTIAVTNFVAVRLATSLEPVSPIITACDTRGSVV